MGNTFLGIAAVGFMLPVLWLYYMEGMIGRTAQGNGEQHDRKLSVWSSVLIVGVMGGFFLAKFRCMVYRQDLFCGIKDLFTYAWLIPVALIDGSAHRIPNRWIMYGFIGAVFFLLAESFAGASGWNVMTSGFVGALFGGGFFLLISLMTNGGIGMGDAKMYMILGLLIGREHIFTLILLTLVLALAHGIVLMMRKKADRKTKIPLGPFTFAAVIVLFLLNK